MNNAKSTIMNEYAVSLRNVSYFLFLQMSYLFFPKMSYLFIYLFIYSLCLMRVAQLVYSNLPWGPQTLAYII